MSPCRYKRLRGFCSSLGKWGFVAPSNFKLLEQDKCKNMNMSDDINNNTTTKNFFPGQSYKVECEYVYIRDDFNHPIGALTKGETVLFQRFADEDKFWCIGYSFAVNKQGKVQCNCL